MSTLKKLSATSTLTSKNVTSQVGVASKMPHTVRSNLRCTLGKEKFTPSICMFTISSLVATVVAVTVGVLVLVSAVVRFVAVVV